jgi:hypothetical protein
MHSKARECEELAYVSYETWQDVTEEPSAICESLTQQSIWIPDA